MNEQKKERARSNSKRSQTIIADYHMLAVKAKFMGMTSQETSELLRTTLNKEINEGTIRWWFCKDGPLHNFFDEYAKEMMAEEMRTARLMIKGKVTLALRALIKEMNAGGMTAVAAAKIWLEKAETLKEAGDDEEVKSMLDKYFEKAETKLLENENGDNKDIS